MQGNPFSIASPKVVKYLISATVLITLIAPPLTFLLSHFFHLNGPSLWLSLSYLGLKEGWLFEPLTYFFIHTNTYAITLSLLFSLLFHMLLLFVAGREIALRYGSFPFLSLYLGGGLFAGIVASFFLISTHSPLVLYGSSPAIFSLLAAWAFRPQNFQLALFFFWRIGARALVLFLFALSLLIHLIHLEWLAIIAESSGLIFGYLFALVVFRKEPSLRVYEKKNRDIEVEVTPLQEPDDEFMDRMLEKISTQGKQSLTGKEKKRMDEISRKKN